MAIGYTPATNTILVTGYSLLTPCNFTDIYNADVAGGWGVVSKQGTSQFYIAAGLTVGDGVNPAYLQTLMESIVIVPSNRQIKIMAYGHLTSGRLLNSRPVDGSTISNEWATYSSPHIGFYAYADSEIKFYNSTYLGNNTCVAILGNFEGKNVNFNRANHITFGGGTNDLDEIHFENIDNAAISGITSANINRTEIYNSGTGVSNHTYVEAILSNSKIYTSTYSLWLRHRKIITMIDSEFDETKIFGEVDGGGGIVNKRFTFNLKVTDVDGVVISGVTVKIWDKYNTLVVDTTTDFAGNITQQTITTDIWDGVGLPPAKTTYSPHTIEIKKAGYQTYKKKFTLDKKIDWTIRLKRIAINIDAEVIC